MQITTHPANDDAPDWAPDGSAITFSSNRAGNDDIWIYRMSDGNLRQLTDHPGSDWYPKWSPDGSEIVFCSDRDGTLDIWKKPASGGAAQRITDYAASEWAPAWSPDGSRIVFVGDMSGNNDLWTIASDGTGDSTQVTTYTGHDLLASWSPDGSRLVFSSDRSGNLDLWTIPADGGTATRITTEPSYEGNPDWSPDGAYIAFGSDRSGSFQVWVALLGPLMRDTLGNIVNDGGNSTGVCWVDYDGDNLPDLYVLNQEGEDNYLYHNDGNGTYTRVTWEPLATDGASSYGASMADYDNDGDVDVVVANFKGDANVLYVNEGFGGGFTIAEGCAISSDPAGSTSSSWIDYDLDGDLDLFIANSSNDLPEYPPFINFLYRHDGDSLVRIVSGDIVTTAKHTYGSGWADYDNDGDPDLVNSNNMYETMDLFRNDGAGNFTRLPDSFLGSDTTNGGGVSWADYDNDGDLDLFVASFWPGPSLLYENDGAGALTKVIGHGLGIGSGRASGGLWGDYDNDGDQDIFVWLNDWQVPENAHGYIFENNGQGTFEQLPAAYFSCDSCLAHGAVWADDDRDGDLDLYITRVIYPVGADNVLYRNNGNLNNWITVKPVGTLSNRSAIGARVTIWAVVNGAPVRQMQELVSQTVGFSQGPLELHFGLGDAMIIDSIVVEWPGGAQNVRINVAVNQFLVITEMLCGDANGDGDINVGDAVYIINYVFRDGPPPDPLAIGDANGDGAANVGDAVYLINYVFKNGPAPAADC